MNKSFDFYFDFISPYAFIAHNKIKKIEKDTKRDNFMKKMLDEGIETGIHYNPVHKMNFYNKKQKLSISEKVGDTIVSLPIHPNLSEKDIEKIIKTTNKLL